jgi:small subunit ribosomal protein S2
MGMERELEKLEINLGGVSTMTRLPDAVFVADPKREAIATKEVNKLGLPLIGLVDTNCDPDEVDYLIPGNDDAIRSCSLIVKTLVRAVEEGRAKFQVSDFLAAEAAREAAQAQAARGAEQAREGAGEGGPRSREARGQRPQMGERRGGPGRPGAGRPGGSRPYSSDAPRQSGREETGSRPVTSRPPRAPRPAAAPEAPAEKGEAAEKPAEEAVGETREEA